MSEIYFTEIKKDSKGRKWYVINGDTGYLMSDWLIEDADADYMSEKAQLEREIDFRRANGFYD